MVWKWPWGVTVEAARQLNARKMGKSGEPWCVCNWLSFTRPFLLGPLFFCTALSCSGGYHLERGRMALHVAVGVNCENGTTTENQGAGVKYMVQGVYVGWLCVCSLTWHDYRPLLSRGRKWCYIIIMMRNMFVILNAVIETINSHISTRIYKNNIHI